MRSTQVVSVNSLASRCAEAETLYWIWRRRSVRLRFVVSWLASWCLHGCLILLLVWGGKALTTKSGEPPRIDVVAAVGEVTGAPGFGDDGLALGLDNGLSSPPPAGANSAASTSSFLPESVPSAIADSFPKPPDVELPGADIVGSMLNGSGGVFGGIDGGGGGGAGGQGGGGGSGASGFGAGWTTTRFFGAQVWGSKFVFVIDRSGSMSQRDRLGSAKREIMASLTHLPPDSQFQIIFYNFRAEVMPFGGNARRLVYATDTNKNLASRHLDSIIADGGTDHLPALKTALSLGPDVIFFLTDADDLREREVMEATELNKGRANIHTIEFGIGPEVDRQNMLRDLANQNGGSYRYIEVDKLQHSSREGKR